MNIISVAGIWDRGNCKRALVRLRLCESGSIKPDVRMLAQIRAKNLFNWIIIIISECCAGILGEVPRHAWSKDSARSIWVAPMCSDLRTWWLKMIPIPSWSYGEGRGLR